MAAQVRHVDRWVSEGIISHDQAESICEFERQVTPSRGTAVEVLAYIGAAMVASAAFVMVLDMWGDLSRASRLSVLVVVAASLVTIGEVTAHDGSPTIRRFSRTTLMLSVPVIGIAAGVAIEPWVDTSTSVVIGSGAASGAAIAMYRQHRSTPQHIALFFAVFSFVFSLAMNLFERVPDALPGAVIFSVGLVWLTLATMGGITPRIVGEILGAGAAVVGSMVLVASVDSAAGVAAGVFVIVSGAAVALGVTRGRVPLTVAGVVGLIMHIPWVTDAIFGSALGAPLALLATGVAITFAALRSTKRV